MIRTVGRPVGLTVMGEGVLSGSTISATVPSRQTAPANPTPRLPRPLRCIDRLPIRTSDGVDDMMTKRGSGVGVV